LVAQVRVDDAGADVGHLGPFGELVDHEGVQMLVVGHGDVKQVAKLVRHLELLP
jgi:hypothetical protein